MVSRERNWPYIRGRTLAFFLVLLAFAWACFGCGPKDENAAPRPDAGRTATAEAGTEPVPNQPDEPRPGNNGEDAPRPSIISVDPHQGFLGGVGPTVLVVGKSFVPRTVVQLDGAALVTSYVSPTELRATIPTSKLASLGTLRISVGTSPPGGGASEEIEFPVVYPAPTLTSLTPNFVAVGSGATTLSASGSNFVPGAKVLFDGLVLPTSFDSSTELSATIPSSELLQPGSFSVSVVNPTPGGGSSQAIAFTITNPSVQLTHVRPSQANAGAPSTFITVSGNGFTSSSKVNFNGQLLATTFANANELSATVPASLLATAGEFPVTVSTSGGPSAPLQFRVLNPPPALTSLAPVGVPVGSPATDVTLNGSGFVTTSQVLFDGGPTSTTYVSPTQLRATFPQALLSSAAIVNVRVVNPTPGGGASNVAGFSISNAGPSIASLSPNFVTLNSSATAVRIVGTGFVNTSVVRANGVALPAQLMSSTELKVTIPATQLTSVGPIAITVTNAPPGGGTSNTVELNVGCDTSGVEVSMSTIGTVTTLNADLAGGAMRFASAGTCPASIDSGTKAAYRAVVVQNATGRPVTLSAWAVCQSTDDAFLAVYRRATRPVTVPDRENCVGSVSEGTSSGLSLLSPDSGGSSWCPGLTKSNGGGVPLAICEKAVVYLQAFGTEFTAPDKLRLKAE